MFNTVPPTGVPLGNIASDVIPPGSNDSFQDLLAGRLGGEGDSYLFNSGRSALYLLLKAAQKLHPDKNEIIIPDYTCWSVPSAIVKAGLKVRPIDIEPNRFGLNAQLLPYAINNKTLAVIVTHLFGIPGEIAAVENICRDKQVLLIDDAAQGLGSSVAGRQLGSFGDAGLLSFGRGKCITTIGGGAALIRNKELSESFGNLYDALPDTATASLSDKIQLLLYRLFFNRHLYWIPDNLPFLRIGETIYNPDFPVRKMAENRERLGRIMMDRLDQINQNRVTVANKYRSKLQGIKGIELPDICDDIKPCFLRMPVLISNNSKREKILKFGHRLGISCMYPGPVSKLPERSSDITRECDCSVAEKVANSLITLPTHFGVTDRDVDKIADLLENGK